MAAISDKLIKAEVARLAKTIAWDEPQQGWKAEHSAVAVVRIVLQWMGCKEEMAPEQQESRADLAKAIKFFFTAAINVERDYIADTKDDATGEPLAPKREKGSKPASVASTLA